jgi:hypothetical protein
MENKEEASVLSQVPYLHERVAQFTRSIMGLHGNENHVTLPEYQHGYRGKNQTL